MTFSKGVSGCPSGRPKGILDKRVDRAKLFASNADALISKVIQLALDGDVAALRICIDRISPVKKRESLDFELPDRITFTNLPEVQRLILASALDGKISPDDAASLCALVNAQCEF